MLSSRPHQAAPGIMTTHNHIEQLDLWIGGEHTPSSSGKYFDDLDPTDDSVFCRAAEATAEDMDRAVRTAHEAFRSYRQTTPRQREQWLARAADIIERDRDSIVDTIVTENGSPIIKARFETLAAADYIRSAAGITRRIVGETHPSDNPGRMVMSVREPLGVVGSITPFNVPFLKAAKDARAKGATVVTGGEWVGNRCQPTILTGVREGMTVFREETFGPVDAIYPVDGLEDGLALANDTNYGLSAAVWTKDIDKAMLYARSIESGTVHINAATFYDEPHVPFGGVKDSGIGREGTEMDIEALTEWKLITLQLPGERAFGAPAVVD